MASDLSAVLRGGLSNKKMGGQDGFMNFQLRPVQPRKASLELLRCALLSASGSLVSSACAGQQRISGSHGKICKAGDLESKEQRLWPVSYLRGETSGPRLLKSDACIRVM